MEEKREVFLNSIDRKTGVYGRIKVYKLKQKLLNKKMLRETRFDLSPFEKEKEYIYTRILKDTQREEDV